MGLTVLRVLRREQHRPLTNAPLWPDTHVENDVIEWKRAAQADLLTIIDYISADNPDAAEALKNEINAKVSMLPEQSQLYREGRVPGTREMVVRSNYVVVYRASDTITVLRMLHWAQQWPP